MDGDWLRGRCKHDSVWMMMIVMMIGGLGFGIHVDMSVRVKEVGGGGKWLNQQKLKVLEIINERSGKKGVRQGDGQDDGDGD